MKLSICCITYNHEKFIAQALDGFLSQKTNFDFEIVIGEDCSTDNALSIIKRYQEKYPDKIKLLANVTNIGMIPNFIQTLNACSSKYIALCEGDDYWTDECKLQKQVDFLEENPDYVICFHEAITLHEDGKEFLFNNIGQNRTFDFLDLTQKNFISTASCVFRMYAHHYSLPDWFLKISAGDWGLHLLNATKGKIYYIKDCMSVYRIHTQGVWSSLPPDEMLGKGIELMNQLNAAFDFKYNECFEKGKVQRIVNFNQTNITPAVYKESFKVRLKKKIKNYLRLKL